MLSQKTVFVHAQDVHLHDCSEMMVFLLIWFR